MKRQRAGHRVLMGLSEEWGSDPSGLQLCEQPAFMVGGALGWAACSRGEGPASWDTSCPLCPLREPTVPCLMAGLYCLLPGGVRQGHAPCHRRDGRLPFFKTVGRTARAAGYFVQGSREAWQSLDS